MDGRNTAQLVRTVFGGATRVTRYGNPDESLTVNILQSVDLPQTGVTSYATIDMADLDNQTSEKQAPYRPIRLELLAVCGSNFVGMAQALSTCAFNVGSGDYSVTGPGLVFPGVIADADPSVRMRHALLVSPFFWGDLTPATSYEDDRITTWLHVVPIDDAEFALAADRGVDTLQETLETSGVDILDINRPSAV